MRTLYPLPGAALGLGAAEVDELHADVRGMEAEELVEVDPAWVGLGVAVTRRGRGRGRVGFAVRVRVRVRVRANRCG